MRYKHSSLYRKHLLTFFLILCLFLQVTAQYAEAEEKRARTLPGKAEPIEIVSDRLDAYNESRLVVFSGNAIATQGNRVIKADRLLLYYSKNPDDPKLIAAEAFGRRGELERVEAKGRVVVTEGERMVSGNEAVFYQDTRKIIMTGDAVMREGDNVIRGEKIVVFLNENRGVVESDGNKRVTATIYPRETREKKK